MDQKLLKKPLFRELRDILHGDWASEVPDHVEGTIAKKWVDARISEIKAYRKNSGDFLPARRRWVQLIGQEILNKRLEEIRKAERSGYYE